MWAALDQPEQSGSQEQIRGLLAEFSDHIVNVLQHELSLQTAVLKTIIHREGGHQSQGAGQSLEAPGAGASGIPRRGGEDAAGPGGSTAERGPLAVPEGGVLAASGVALPAMHGPAGKVAVPEGAVPEATGSMGARGAVGTVAAVALRRTASAGVVPKHELDESDLTKTLRVTDFKRTSTSARMTDVLTDLGSLWTTAVSGGRAWHPDSATRMVYETLSMLAVMYDGIMIPYTLAWNVLEEGVFGSISLFSRMFWTMDLLLSFITGYHTKQRSVELRLKKTAKHFLMTWFVVDVTLVIWDWIGMVLPGLRLIRFVRLIRMSRQSRRAFALARRVKTMFYAKVVHLAVNISTLLVMFFWMAHVLCCGWYALGKDPTFSDTGATWLVQRDGNAPYSSFGFAFEYTSALHWSLTQFTPASMEVVPVSTRERIYTIAVIMWGFLVGSTIVATLSAMMTQYRLQVEESHLKLRQLDAYLDQEQINPELSMVARMQILRTLRERQRLRASEVSHLRLLSNTMQRAVRAHVVSRHLSSHVFFGVWCQVDRESLAVFCSSCVEDRFYKAGDTCFLEHEDGRTMFFVKVGALSYKPGSRAPETSFSADDPRLTCRAFSVAAEVAMWLKWVHLGTMVSSATTEVFSVKTDVWAEEAVRHEFSAQPVRDYAIAFHSYMSERDAIVSDLTYGIDYHGLMFAMPLSSRVVMCEALLQCGPSDRVGPSGADGTEMTSSSFLTRVSRAQVQKLRDEVSKGKTCLGVVEQQLVRFVFVVAMRIYKRSNFEEEAVNVDEISVDDFQGVGNNRYLVKLGEMDRSTDNVSTTCVLPGSKRREQETTVATMERVVAEDLGTIGASIEWHPMVGRSETRTFKDSPTQGLKTMYSRTLYTGFASYAHTAPSIPAPGERFAPQFSMQPTGLTSRCTKRSRSTRMQVAQKRVTEILRGIPEVVVCDRGTRSSWYAWLLDEEFLALEGGDARPILEQWVREVAQNREFVRFSLTT